MDAVEKMRLYLTDFTTSDVNGSGLVAMPTGTGKSRVIAVLTRLLRGVDRSIVLAPRRALAFQLIGSLQNATILKDLAALGRNAKPVLSLASNTDAGSLPKKWVGVCTIQMLQKIEQLNPVLYESLGNDVDLTVVDEGHYEPARSWSKSIRNLGGARILFTATPYRNDYKAFDIREDHRFFFRHCDAEDSLTIRKVLFHDRPSIPDPKAFVLDVVDAYHNFFGTDLIQAEKSRTAKRVIIRCESSSSIRQIESVLDDMDIGYTAVHERFAESQKVSGEHKHVPVFHDHSPLVWIHQYKLLEGIDNPSFQMLAMFDPFTQTRSLVQQVGRVVRNTERLPNQIAHVLDHSSGHHRKLWDSYRAFDASAAKVLLTNSERYVDTYVRIFAEPLYVDGRFRDRYELDTAEPAEDLQLPMSVNLYNVGRAFSPLDFVRQTTQRLAAQDRAFRLFEISPSRWVISSIGFRNSPLLTSKYLMEVSHEVTFIGAGARTLAFYDSGGFTVSPRMHRGVLSPVSATVLRRLYRARSRSRITHVALHNTDIGTNAVLRRSIVASSVFSSPPFLDDHNHVMSSAVGYSQEHPSELGYLGADADTNDRLVRRYVGFFRGRVSQAGDLLSLDAYLEWVDEVLKTLERKARTPMAFDRYARSSTVPRKPTPRNVLIDTTEIEEEFVDIRTGEAITIDNRCQDVSERVVVIGDEKVKKLCFVVNANGEAHNVLIQFRPDKGDYFLESESLQKGYRRTLGPRSTYGRANFREGVIDYLNRTQSLRVVPESMGSVYVGGSFHTPYYRFGKGFDKGDFQIADSFEIVPELDLVVSEKGKRCLSDGTGWEPNSVFGLIGNDIAHGPFARFVDDPVILVCDDMRTEVADFVLLDRSEQRVVFVHAKSVPITRDRRPYGASAISEVCAQAIKNIGYISMFSRQRPKNLGSWGGSWSAPPSTEGEVTRRVRLPESFAGSGEELWLRIHEAIRSPRTSREIWIVIGRALYPQSLYRELSKSPPTPEAVQSAVLLHGTLATVGSVNARLRVFCPEMNTP